MGSSAPVPPGAERAPALLISIVSHGHGAMVQRLLHQLALPCAAICIARVVLTRNIPESAPVPPPQGWPFVLQIIDNPAPLGFGANHNQALQGAVEPFVCVLNPDVELLDEEPFAALIEAARCEGVGCAYPLQVDGQGRVQDSEREIPTPLALWRRRVLRRPQQRVDWVNAACIVMPLHVWQAVKGFDEAYFMYCEDVDLCLRIRLLGLGLQRADARVVHAGQRASGRQWRHLAWHVRSLLRLWGSRTCRQAVRLPGGNRLQ